MALGAKRTEEGIVTPASTSHSIGPPLKNGLLPPGDYKGIYIVNPNPPPNTQHAPGKIDIGPQSALNDTGEDIAFPKPHQSPNPNPGNRPFPKIEGKVEAKLPPGEQKLDKELTAETFGKPPKPIEAKVDMTSKPIEAKVDTISRPIEAKVDTIPKPIEAKVDTISKPIEAKLDNTSIPTANMMKLPPVVVLPNYPINLEGTINAGPASPGDDQGKDIPNPKPNLNPNPLPSTNHVPGKVDSGPAAPLNDSGEDLEFPKPHQSPNPNPGNRPLSKLEAMAYAKLLEQKINGIESKVNKNPNPIEGKAEAKPIEPKVDKTPIEPKVDEKPIEPKIDEKPIEPKIDEKPIEPKVDEKPIEPKIDEKPIEPKVDEKPIEPKIDEKPIEPKVDEKPIEPKIDEKPIEPKVDEKPIEPKIDEKPIEPKIDEKPIEPKIDEKPIEPKVDEKPVEPKVDEKPIEPKVDEKPIEPKVDEKPIEPKVDEKPIEPKIDEKPIEPKTDEKPLEMKLDAKPVESKNHGKLLESKFEGKPVGYGTSTPTKAKEGDESKHMEWKVPTSKPPGKAVANAPKPIDVNSEFLSHKDNHMESGKAIRHPLGDLNPNPKPKYNEKGKSSPESNNLKETNKNRKSEGRNITDIPIQGKNNNRIDDKTTAPTETKLDGTTSVEGRFDRNNNAHFVSIAAKPDATKSPLVDAKPDAIKSPLVDAKPDAIKSPLVDAKPDAIKTPLVDAKPDAVKSPLVDAKPDAIKSPLVDAKPDAVKSPLVDAKPNAIKSPLVDAKPDAVKTPLVDAKPDAIKTPLVDAKPDAVKSPLVDAKPDAVKSNGTSNNISKSPTEVSIHIRVHGTKNGSNSSIKYKNKFTNEANNKVSINIKVKPDKGKKSNETKFIIRKDPPIEVMIAKMNNTQYFATEPKSDEREEAKLPTMNGNNNRDNVLIDMMDLNVDERPDDLKNDKLLSLAEAIGMGNPDKMKNITMGKIEGKPDETKNLQLPISNKTDYGNYLIKPPALVGNLNEVNSSEIIKLGGKPEEVKNVKLPFNNNKRPDEKNKEVNVYHGKDVSMTISVSHKHDAPSTEAKTNGTLDDANLIAIEGKGFDLPTYVSTWKEKGNKTVDKVEAKLDTELQPGSNVTMEPAKNLSNNDQPNGKIQNVTSLIREHVNMGRQKFFVFFPLYIFISGR